MVDTAPAHSTPKASTPKADAAGDPAAGTPVGSTAAGVRIDTDLVAELLLGRWAEDRRISRRLALDPAMHKIEGMPYADARSRTLDQLRIILLLTPLIMIAAMGQMMVIVARHIDLSIGSILGVSAMVSGMLYRWDATWLGFDVP